MFLPASPLQRRFAKIIVLYFIKTFDGKKARFCQSLLLLLLFSNLFFAYGGFFLAWSWWFLILAGTRKGKDSRTSQDGNKGKGAVWGRDDMKILAALAIFVFSTFTSKIETSMRHLAKTVFRSCAWCVMFQNSTIGLKTDHLMSYMTKSCL